MPRSDRLDSEDSVEMVCPAPQRTLVLPFTEWSGANTQMDLGVHAAFLPQQGALSEEQCWAADGCVSNAALWPVQAAEYPFANGTAAGFDATLMHGAVNKDIEPIYGEDSSATYNAGNWARCGAGGSCLYGAGGSAMYEDNPYLYGDGTYMSGGCMYGTGVTYANAAGSLDVFATDSTAGTTIGSGSSPSRNTAVESHSTTTTMPMVTTTTTSMTTPGNRSCYVPNSPGAGTSSYIASSPADYAPIPTESLSESSSSSFGQAVPAHTHLQDLDVESTSIMQNFT
jgi:hypothetical protein